MIKIEAVTLEAAYKNAASQLECSVTELTIEVVQPPSKGFLGLFKKPAIIVAVKDLRSKSSKKDDPILKQEDSKNKNETSQAPKVVKNENTKVKEKHKTKNKEENTSNSQESTKLPKEDKRENTNKALKISKAEKYENSKLKEQKRRPKKQRSKIQEENKESHSILNDTIMPASFVSMQDDEEEYDVSSYLADYDEDEDDCQECKNISEIAKAVSKEINELFDLTCFNIEKIEVSIHDENTLLLEFKGEDAALLIGKEGYRYKALSYMIFNWLNTKYQIQLRLEIAEFLKNQEESISKYLVGVCANIDRDGRAQTKILDGVLVQIALNELRDKYPNKYIVIRSTRDGLKYIIVNDYHANS